MSAYTKEQLFLLAFGVLGNLISFFVYLSPIPTFIKIYKSKSTQNYQSLPYNVALFSCILWIYYAHLKGNSILLVFVNYVGCVIECVYLIIYIIYASKKARIATAQMFVLLNVVIFAVIVLVAQFMFEGPHRAFVVGWICVAFSISVYAAPLSIIRLVVRTQSVEYMPFNLSFFLTLSAISWFGYGVFTKDMFVAIPTVLGFLFGVAQMVLYVIYKRKAAAAAAAAAAAEAPVAEHRSGSDASDSPDVIEENDRVQEGSESSSIAPEPLPPPASRARVGAAEKKDRRPVKKAPKKDAAGPPPPPPLPPKRTAKAAAQMQLAREKERGKRVVEVGESSGMAAEAEVTVPEHIMQIAEHIAKISEHIVKMAEMTPKEKHVEEKGDGIPEKHLEEVVEADDEYSSESGEAHVSVAEHVINITELEAAAAAAAAAKEEEPRKKKRELSRRTTRRVKA